MILAVQFGAVAVRGPEPIYVSQNARGEVSLRVSVVLGARAAPPPSFLLRSSVLTGITSVTKKHLLGLIFRSVWTSTSTVHGFRLPMELRCHILGFVFLLAAWTIAADSDIKNILERRRNRVKLSTNNQRGQSGDEDVVPTPAESIVRPQRTSSNSIVERARRPLFARRRPAVATSSKATAVSSDKRSSSSPDGDMKYVCYYTNWSQYRQKLGKFLPEDVDPELCTHVIFAFGWLKKGKLAAFESNDDSEDGKKGLFERVVAMKEKNSKLKILLAIGGWSFGTKKFQDMSETRYSRQTFIFSAIPFLRDRGFDGLDIDWEYPKGADDKKNYVLLLKELREAFDAESQEVKKPRLLLTAAVPVGPDNVNSGYDVPAVASYLDFINLMAYDFHGKWEKQAGHNAPLFAPSSDSEWRKQLSVSNAAEMWVRKGAPKDKLVIGMPTYGRTFTLSNPKNYQVNAPASGGGKAGTYTKESGFLAYYEICEMLRGGAKYIWDPEMEVPYVVDGDQWVGFDDERSLRNKIKWLKKEGYAGAMVWSIDMDDFTGGVCGGGGKYPLMTAMREELFGVKRDPGFKDVDWSKVSKFSEVAGGTTLPPPVRISVEELLQSLKRKDDLPTTLVQGSKVLASDSSATDPTVLCYFTNWSVKRPGRGKFKPEYLDPHLCTHVVYAFAALDKNYLLTPGGDEDKESEEMDLYSRVQALREANPRLKVLLAIGGWSFGSKPFKELTENAYRMNSFVYHALEFLREYKFDGLDVDWEYPRGEEDKENYVRLLKELRSAFEGEAKTAKLPRLILSAAVPASFEAVAAGYDVPEISKYLDFVNVMTYDFHGQWERQVGHNSPLFPLESASSYQKKLTVDYSAREWVKRGAPKEKLLIGMPTYGRSFTLVNESKFDIGAPASGGGEPGEFTGEPGFLSYYEICEFLHRDNVTLVWDNEQQVPFAYREDQWVGFDDERSLKTKMEWLRDLGFGGVMVWSVDMDDFKGDCGMGKYPLLKALKSALEGYAVHREYEGPYDGPNVYAAAANRKEHLILSISIGDLSRLGRVMPRKHGSGADEVVCDEDEGGISYHVDKEDCHQYYLCQGDRKHRMPCPQGLVFNERENVCDWPANVERCAHLAAPTR
ncbi:unnamed protein product [Darwinula stevensoni]|uniref:Chitinase n=1 Tax=Darwinula stevensoni TaxID=69355 RepID=A0A7R8X0V6_9CRUS|nr:unnamed protein product [Darwinula stevensoni]CAG0881604.1 unnamed protein product [Darwinula stevensoni]